MARTRFTGQFVFPLIALALFALAIHFLPSFAPPTITEAELRALSEAQVRDYWRGHTIYEWIEKLVKIALALSAMFLVVRLASAFLFNFVFRIRKRREAPRFLRDIFALVAYVIITAIILKYFFKDLSLGALLSGSALLGIIVGLALQDTLGNLFAGVSLQADKPFEVGDVISVGSFTGVVESVTWRAVKLRTFQNHLVLVSNSALAKEQIEVAPRDNQNARLVFFNALYTDSPAKVIHVVREAVRDAENVSQEITPIVRIRSLGDFAVDYEIKYWLDNYAKYNDTDALVRQLIWYAFRRNALTFAYPTQTLFLDRPARDGGRPATVLDRVTERLSAVDIFAPLSPEELARLAASCESRTYAPGELIIRAHDAGDSMFVINRGGVNVRVTSSDGKTRTVAALEEGAFFGEMALFTGEPRTASVVAKEETEVLEIGHQAMKHLFETNPDLVESLSHTIEERRVGLNATVARRSLGDEPASLLTNIKRFFGLD